MSTIQEFDYSIDFLQFIFWQYDNSNVGELTKQKNTFIKEFNEDFWNQWYNEVFNLKTASNFGISVWAIILDLPLVFEPSMPFTVGLGFGSSRKNFGNGNFSPVTSALSRLTLEQRRLILILKYRLVTARGTVTDINKILFDVFGSLGTSYVRDNLNMTISYVFDFAVQPWIPFIEHEFGILPTPAGVKANILGENVLPETLDFLTDWVLVVGEGLILDSNTIQTSNTNTNTPIVELLNAMDFLLDSIGNVQIQIVARSISPGAVFQFGYTASGAADQLSGGIALTSDYQTFTVTAPLDNLATSYQPAIFNPTIAGQYDIEVQNFYINIIIG